jgi:hypothetical protein
MLPRSARRCSASGTRSGRRRANTLLLLEALEDRCLLSAYDFTLIADNGPDSIFSLAALNQPGLNDQGTAMFHSALKSGGIGVFTRDTEGSLVTIALTGDLAKDFFLGGGITDGGTVSFGANLAAGGQAIFTGAGEELTRIADTGPDSPFSSFLAPAAPINNDETVAFRATLKSGGTGIFTDRAGEAPQVLYVTGGQFRAFLDAPIIQRNGNEVGFSATLNTGQDGIFLGDGLTTTTIATTGGAYSALRGGATNDEGMVVFRANLAAGGQTIVEGDGSQLTTIAQTGGRFTSFFGNTAINNDGQVVFAANQAAGGSGLFIAHDGEVEEIIGTGDRLFGSTVTSFTANPFAPRGFNNEGELGFSANLADGRTVIVRADPEDAGAAHPAHDLAGGRTVIARADVTIVPSGSVNVAAALPDAGRPAPAGIGTGTSLAVAGELPDDLRPAVAAALNASSRPLAPTPTVLTRENVERLDQLFTAGLEDGTSFDLPRSKHDLLSFSEEDGVDTDF